MFRQSRWTRSPALDQMCVFRNVGGLPSFEGRRLLACNCVGNVALWIKPAPSVEPSVSPQTDDTPSPNVKVFEVWGLGSMPILAWVCAGVCRCGLSRLVLNYDAVAGLGRWHAAGRAEASADRSGLSGGPRHAATSEQRGPDRGREEKSGGRARGHARAAGPAGAVFEIRSRLADCRHAGASRLEPWHLNQDGNQTLALALKLPALWAFPFLDIFLSRKLASRMSAEGNYARPKAISTEGRGAVEASWTISSSSANTRRTPVASVIFRLSAQGDSTSCGAASLEHVKTNAPTLPPAHTKLSSSQLAAIANPMG
jgi:hypothetical protein